MPPWVALTLASVMTETGCASAHPGRSTAVHASVNTSRPKAFVTA